jgi:NADPH-dependent curcumin reductase CurA
MADTNRRFLLRERPTERIGADTFELVEEEVPQIEDGQALVKSEWISVEPTMRTWLNDAPGYLPPVAIGDPMRALGLARVVASKNPNYEEGQLYQGLTNFQEYLVASDEAPLMPVNEVEGVSDSAYLGVLGMTGLTAWVGTTQIGEPKEGETFVVSAAAGAVGSVAGQLAKAHGARVVGIAGGPEKCALLTEKLGYDAAVDHKAEDWFKQLKEATPDGIDVDFENVGGKIMEAILGRINICARIALCGLISTYNDAEGAGSRGFEMVLIRRAMVKGFIVLDHFGQAREAAAELSQLMADGKLEALETVVEGFDQLPDAINMLFDGKNTGKLVVRVGDG